MEPTSFYRNIGIILSLVTISVVGGITYISEKKTSSSVALAAQTTLIPKVQTVQSDTKVKTAVTPTQTTTVSSHRVTSREDEEGSEGGDDDGGYTRTPSTPAPTPVKVVSQTPPADTTKQQTSPYKDGTYTAIGSYMSPGGPDQLSVTLTLKNGVVTDASVTPMPGDRTSAEFQNMFISGYKQYVVGQNIDSINLSVVSGSSLTPNGFNDALSQIKTQAQA